MDTEENEQISKLSKQRLVTAQHFSTTAEDFTDGVFNLCVRDFVEIIPTAKQFLQENFPGQFSSPEEFNACLKKFVKRFYSSLDINSDILEKYMRDAILNIPEDVIIPGTSINESYSNLQRKEGGDLFGKQQAEVEKLIKDFKHYTFCVANRKQRLKEIEIMESKLLTLQEQLRLHSKQCDTSSLSSLLSKVPITSSYISQLQKTDEAQ